MIGKTTSGSIVVNCEKIDFSSTLGVAGFLVRLCEQLALHIQLTFVLKDSAQHHAAVVKNRISMFASSVLSFEEAKAISWGEDSIELLPHHFQQRRFCAKSILICHDLHIFDIPWKYPNVETTIKAFRNNLTNASVVVTHFPRTYYEVEKYIGVKLNNLFITESPLMLDTSVISRSEATGKTETKRSEGFLLYPAQLQAHKNHKALIYAAEQLKADGSDVEILCPGSSFDPVFTRYLHDLIRDYGVHDNVRLLGHVSDCELVDLYRLCAAVIIPSLAEGGAYVAMEAIAAGKRVAVHKTIAAQMHVSSFDGAVIWFDAKSTSDTADAIHKLLADDPAEERNEAARERIGSTNWGTVAERWLEIVRWLNGARAKPSISISPKLDRISYT